MKSFGRLLRQMRGTTPVEEIARQTGIAADYLRSVERGRRILPELIAHEILRRVFALDEREAMRVLLGIQLYGLGLKDAELRQPVIDIIHQELSRPIQEQLRKVYRRYIAS